MLWAGTHPALAARPGLGSLGLWGRAPLPRQALGMSILSSGSAQGQSSHTPSGVYAKPPRWADAKQCGPDSLCNEGRQRRLQDFQRECRPANLWSLMALDILLKMCLVGLQEHGLASLGKIWFAGAGWCVERRSRCKFLQNPVLVQWIKTSLMIKRLFLCLHPVQRMRLSCILPKSCAKRITGSSKYLSRFGQGNRISLSGGGCLLKAVIEVKLGSRDSEDSYVRRSIRPLNRN